LQSSFNVFFFSQKATSKSQMAIITPGQSTLLNTGIGNCFAILEPDILYF